MKNSAQQIFRLVFLVSFRSFWARKSVWLGTLLFALCLLILFPFSFGTDVIKRPDIQIGCFWVISEFVAALCVGRLFSAEQEAYALDVLLSSRSSRTAILFAKMLFTTILIFSFECTILLFWVVLFNVAPASFVLFYSTLFATCLLFSFSSASVGVLVYSLTARSLAREILQPILFFPLQTAVLLASVCLCLSANSLHSLSGALGTQAWWSFLFLYPIIFSALGWVFSFLLLEE